MELLGRVFSVVLILTLSLDWFRSSEAGLLREKGLLKDIIPHRTNESVAKIPVPVPIPISVPGRPTTEQTKSVIPNNVTLVLANRTIEDKAYDACKSVGGVAGHCRHLRHCLIDDFLESPKSIDDYSCSILNRYIGICCPDNRKVQKPSASPAETAASVKKVDGRVIFGLPKRQKPPTIVSQPSPLGPPGRNRGCGVNALENSSPTLSIDRTDSGEYPWMAAIVRTSDGEQFCGGVLLDQVHILTAAHCFRSVKLDDLFVVLGEYDLTEPNETRSQILNVTRLTTHGQYDPVTYENDIAILRLSRPAIFNGYVWPICLPDLEDMDDIVNRSAIVTGWGLMYDGGPASTVLLEVAVPIWDNEQCQEQYAQLILDTALCAAAYQGGKDSCRGDSGGPLMIQKRDGRWTNIGIVSFGISCGLPMQPGVYTRVTKYLAWIEKYTQV